MGIVEQLIEMDLKSPISAEVDISTPINRYLLVVGYNLKTKSESKKEYKQAYSIYA